jgi:hypothetical protein
VAQVGKYLPSTCEALNSNPSTIKTQHTAYPRQAQGTFPECTSTSENEETGGDQGDLSPNPPSVSTVLFHQKSMEQRHQLHVTTGKLRERKYVHCSQAPAGQMDLC